MLPDERQRLGGLLLGPARPASWDDSEPPASGFFAAKGLVEALLATARIEVDWRRAEEPFLHPGRSGWAGTLGYVGELHPAVAGAWDLPPAAVFELDFGGLPEPRVRHFRPFGTFPTVRQDVAVVVGDDVAAGDVVTAAIGASRLLVSAEVFDVYRGERLGAGRSSLALHLIFAADDRTLTEEEATAERERIVAALAEQLGAQLRG
jgi:phenylalanyl-tRNA synthetase beta chain